MFKFQGAEGLPLCDADAFLRLAVAAIQQHGTARATRAAGAGAGGLRPAPAV